MIIRITWVGVTVVTIVTGCIQCLGKPSLELYQKNFWSVRGGEKEAINTNGSPRTYHISVGKEQGFRSYMEDAHYISNNGDFAAVFDGHGGSAVSAYISTNLYSNVQAFLPLAAPGKHDERQEISIQQHDKINLENKPIFDDGVEIISPSSRRQKYPSVDDYSNALRLALEKVDHEILKISHWSFVGSTAVVIWLHEDCDGNITILAANIGDSRAVLSRGKSAVQLTRDHKPDDPKEKSRIERLGGSVIWCGDTDLYGKPVKERGIFRVNGNLALSRAVGDKSERPYVTAEPEIIALPIDNHRDDQFIILATDGLWDVMTSDDAVNYVHALLEKGVSKGEVAIHIAKEALRRDTYDNVTVVVIWMDETKVK